MKPIYNYITDDLVINILCKARVKIADRIRKNEALKNLSGQVYTHKFILAESELVTLLPARKKWKKLCADRRKKGNQSISTYSKNIERLKLTIKHNRSNSPSEEYLARLDKFISDVRNVFCDTSYSISTPETFPKAKSEIKNKKGKIECRPITTYTKLIDIVVTKIANKYLSELFDPLFCNLNSLAFRKKREYYGYRVYTTHNHAIDRILEYQSRHSKRSMYVSECDIKKFYDSVDHSVVKCCFESFISRAAELYPKIDFSPIKRVFLSYLDSYSFYQNVYSKNDDEDYWQKHRVKDGEFEWIFEDLKRLRYSNKKIKNSRIGVPQGGALSGLIANIVLDSADKMVLDSIGQGNALYLRFCDDIIILSTNKSLAKRITSKYAKSLRQLKLIQHKAPEKLIFHKREFWKAKTKKIYKWGTNKENASPWIGFVGYEIRCTGEIRVRKSSIKKECKKQKEVTQKILKLKSLETKKTLLGSINNRLIGMSIGRAELWNYTNFQNELCWVNGFDRLSNNRYLVEQLRFLDRCRNSYIGQAKLKLDKRPLEVIKVSKKADKKIPKYYGCPYSYYYHVKMHK